MRQFRQEARNHLLQGLPSPALHALMPHLNTVELTSRQCITKPGDSLDTVCFIESGLVSLVVEGRDGVQLEVRTIGRDGMIGHSALLGLTRSAHAVIVQIDGFGLQAPTSTVIDSLECPKARAVFHRYLHRCDMELAEAALSAAKYSMKQRLARWLLLCQDRIESNNLPVTHDELAQSLGVRRAGITDQLHVLEGLHAIRSTRGNVRILNRALLIDLAGGCYGAAKDALEPSAEATTGRCPIHQAPLGFPDPLPARAAAAAASMLG